MAERRFGSLARLSKENLSASTVIGCDWIVGEGGREAGRTGERIFFDRVDEAVDEAEEDGGGPLEAMSSGMRVAELRVEFRRLLFGTGIAVGEEGRGVGYARGEVVRVEEVTIALRCRLAEVVVDPAKPGTLL